MQPDRLLLTWLAALAAMLLTAPVSAQNLPALTGRVVDQADLLPPDREAQLTRRLEQLERATTRQLVVVTVPDLQGYAVEDFGFALGEQWKIGNRDADNGAIFLIAPKERRMRIEVGDGLEAILPDILAGRVIREQVTPRFRENDFPGGIEAGVTAIIEQLQAPPEVAEQRALEAAQQERQRREGEVDGDAVIALVFWGFILFFIILPALFGRGGKGRRYRRRRGGVGPVVIWGGGWGGGSSGGSSWGGGGGGFTGGGGSFGGGGASGSW